MGLSGTNHRYDVRLQKAGQRTREEEKRREIGSQREGATGGGGQSIRGEFASFHKSNSLGFSKNTRLLTFIYLEGTSA